MLKNKLMTYKNAEKRRRDIMSDCGFVTVVFIILVSNFNYKRLSVYLERSTFSYLIMAKEQLPTH